MCLFCCCFFNPCRMTHLNNNISSISCIVKVHAWVVMRFKTSVAARLARMHDIHMWRLRIKIRFRYRNRIFLFPVSWGDEEQFQQPQRQISQHWSVEAELLERSDRSGSTESSPLRRLKLPLCHPQQKVIVTWSWRHLSQFNWQLLVQKSFIWMMPILNTLQGV